MEEILIGTHTICVEPPADGLALGGNAAILLNDGELLARLGLRAGRAFLFGIVPNDRLCEYTPWAEKALRPGAPDFGGGLPQYHRQLCTEIVPQLAEAYRLDPARLAYGGFSLGGLAAAMSLWQTERFRFVFSLCGSFWYPGVPEFMAQHPLVNQSAKVLLLNGEREGAGHNNRLQDAAAQARRVHRLLGRQLEVTSVMDGYAHHDRQAERFAFALRWLDEQFGA